MKARGKSRGLALMWSERITVKQIIKSDFCIEIEFESDKEEGECWEVFVYASNRQIIVIQLHN